MQNGRRFKNHDLFSVNVNEIINEEGRKKQINGADISNNDILRGERRNGCTLSVRIV